MDPREHILIWLPVKQGVEKIILCHVFKIMHKLFPVYLWENFVSQDSVHQYSTRHSQKGAFVIPKVKSFGAKSFCFKGCSLWNQLPINILSTDKYHTFKHVLNSYLLNTVTV